MTHREEQAELWPYAKDFSAIEEPYEGPGYDFLPLTDQDCVTG